MENSSRHSRPNSATSLKQRRSGYEPSDTETEWHTTPFRDRNRKKEAWVLDGENEDDPESDLDGNASGPLKINRRNNSKLEEFDEGSTEITKASPITRLQNSKSPCRSKRDNATNLYPRPSAEFRRNPTPPLKTQHLRLISPHRNGTENDLRQDRRIPTREERGKQPKYARRWGTAPRQREEESNDHQPCPLSRHTTPKSSSVGEINEIVANLKLSRMPANSINAASILESTESIQGGDIFFSREVAALAMQKNNNFQKNGGVESNFSRPNRPIFSEMPNLQIEGNRIVEQKQRTDGSSTSNGLSRTNISASAAMSRQMSGQLSTGSSKRSFNGGRSSISLGRFTANRRKKNQAETCFACVRKGACRTTKSPEKRAFDEASFIERAFVVEKLRPFWADKHQPTSLTGFTCHKQEAQLLKQIASNSNIPYILFKGPSGSGKRALTMAFLREIYGDQCSNVSHELRHFHVQEKRPVEVVVPLTSSAHHVELNVNLETNAKYALMGIVKEISNNHDITPEVSTVNFKPDYKVIVLSEVDRAGESIQHMIKWIMDCHADACKLILCCEDDGDILESVKNRCKVIKVHAPVTHEITEVLIQIARKGDFDLSMSFAAKIATKSKQNMRKAIMALEACKAHNYPFVDNQPIPIGWEEVLVELAAEILADPSPKRLFFARGKFQKLLVDFVHPKLILQKLVEQFLKGIVTSLKREVYYWHAYYEKRLPTGTTASLKLEEFVAKFMSIYRKSTSNHQVKAAINHNMF